MSWNESSVRSLTSSTITTARRHLLSFSCYRRFVGIDQANITLRRRTVGLDVRFQGAVEGIELAIQRVEKPPLGNIVCPVIHAPSVHRNLTNGATSVTRVNLPPMPTLVKKPTESSVSWPYKNAAVCQTSPATQKDVNMLTCIHRTRCDCIDTDLSIRKFFAKGTSEIFERRLRAGVDGVVACEGGEEGCAY